MTNKLTKMEKIDIVDLFIELYPDISRDREILINTILGIIKRPNKYILERFDHLNNTYYIDKFGVIIDKNLKFCGCYIDISETRETKIKVIMYRQRNFKNELEYLNKLTDLFYSS
jgi:hypothetical protein